MLMLYQLIADYESGDFSKLNTIAKMAQSPQQLKELHGLTSSTPLSNLGTQIRFHSK